MFSSLKKKYEIVYFAVNLPEELQDNAHSMPLNDIPICRKHNIKVFQEIKGNSWNESMLKVFANCDRFITMNGGYSILASMFGGTNIVYSTYGEKHAKELDIKSFDRWYPNHSNQRVIGVESYEELKKYIDSIYIQELPTANVIIRTSKRPNAFRRAYESVKMQDYPNINIIVTTDEQTGVEYTRGLKARHIAMPRIDIKEKPDSEEYGLPFPQNEYLSITQDCVDGFVLFLDDDDEYLRSDAIRMIMKHADRNKLMVWRTRFDESRLIPNGTFGKKVTLYDITGIGFCYHTDHKELSDWSQWKRADFRTARNLADNLGVIWIDEILTGLQCEPGEGKQIDIITNVNPTITVGLPMYNSNQIAWLALEGLCGQKTEANWELIICEEVNENSCDVNFIKKYRDRLIKAGCVRIKYIRLESWVNLPTKWRLIANEASESSKFLVLQGSDDYSDSERLERSYTAIVKNSYDWYDEQFGYFYDLALKQLIEFDKELIQSDSWRTGVNMAIRIDLVKKLPETDITRGVDTFLYSHASSFDNFSHFQHKIKTESIFTNGTWLSFYLFLAFGCHCFYSNLLLFGLNWNF